MTAIPWSRVFPENSIQVYQAASCFKGFIRSDVSETDSISVIRAMRYEYRCLRYGNAASGSSVQS
jgi:hypothetical protein